LRAAESVRWNAPRYFIDFYRPYVNTNLNAHQRLSTHVDGIVQMNNLLNQFRNDFDAFSPTPGRMTKIGLRVRL
jgi:hypothetical protein